VTVTRLAIHARRPYAAGQAFSPAGAYERIDGLVHFAVNPDDPANTGIVDLDRADRDAHGLVHFTADFCILQPSDPEHGSRNLLYLVANRGRRVLPRQLNRGADLAGSEDIDPGDGFVFRRGLTVAWCGWQWDVIRAPGLIGLDAPTALDDTGAPLLGQVAVEFQPNQQTNDRLLANRVHQPYPVANVDDSEAALTVRDWPDGPRTTIPRDRWRFVDDAHVRLTDGFEPGRIYEVVYRTRRCPVVGAGLLATRDFVSYLRSSSATDNPCAGRITRTFAFGVSQSGRFLRHYLYLGLNVDETGQTVFDGMLHHVAGARRGEFNHRYAQPSVQSTPSFGHLMPFGYDGQTDPLTGRRDGLLARQRVLGGVPRVIATNTSAEYWRGDGSLVHTDLEGKRDVEPPAEVRVYHLAGTQHGPGVLPLVDTEPNEGTRGAHPFNAVDYSPLVRSAFVNLERWVTDDVEPPPNCFPRLADGTAVSAATALESFRRLPRTQVADPTHLARIRRLDLGPDAERGIGRFPAVTGEPYPTFVAAVDSDGNEVAGVRLPDIAVPVATSTGWNTRHATTGGPELLIPMAGSTLQFASSPAERARDADPRPSISERYRDRNDYLARVRAVAQELAVQRLLLPEDVDLVLDAAGRRYDAFSSTTRASTDGLIARR
jgi:hypothetical protein